ncbi:MAG: EAL domain-containing protein [Enterobacterales bacterium]|nr:EAL domain-containing protein [Enterobacterales bacterium]
MERHKHIDSYNSVDVESALYEITELGISSVSMDDYYAKIHQIIGRLTYASNFYIALYDQKTSRVKFVYFVDEVDTDLNLDNLRELTQQDLLKSATGYLLQSKKLLHMSSTQSIQMEKDGLIDRRGSDSADWLGVPLIYKNEVLGAMVIQSYNLDITYGTKEENILMFVARQIALLIKSKLSEQELIESNRMLEKRVKERTESLNEMNSELNLEVDERRKSEDIQAALFKITDLVSTSSSLNDFFASVHQVIAKLMYAENEYIALLSDDDQYVEFLYYVDQIDERPRKRKMTENNKKIGLTERILTSGEVVHFNRHIEDEKATSGTDCASFLGVPLMDKNRTFGVLAVQSYQQDIIYDETDKKVLMTIGKQIAIAILRKKDSDTLKSAHEFLERRVEERTSELQDTINKRKIIEKKLEHDSLHDALTSLPNRLFFSNHLAQQVERNRGGLAENFAVLFLDLDRFKLINDSLGHHVGDLFLIEISQRLTECLRGNDVIARLGGDEFCILMRQIRNKKMAIKLAARILKELKKPVLVEKHSLITSASIGIRMSVDGDASVGEIMSDADAAMYRAKHKGKNCFCVFDSEIKSIVTGRMQIENDLRKAVTNDELFLVFQPVVDLKTEKVVGCEALIRWKHPVQGFLPPDKFIPVAEETGIIVEIGEFVAQKSVEALKEFSKHPHAKHLFININVSTVQILSRTFDDFVRQLLASSQVDPALFNVEITESILIEDYKAATNFVRELKAMGIKVYLDDFGTGFSSLSYLHQFPFDVIKLDKSFIDAMDMGEKNLAIVESISSMANNLHIKIVAEGIETKKQLQRLQQFGYHYGQGYYFAKPIAIQSLLDFVGKELVID